MRVLGIDYGARKVGIAIGDTESRIASPWTVLENEGHGEVIKQVRLVLEREGVERVVVGVPRPLQDASKENQQVVEIRRFIQDLRANGIPVDEADETLSSAQARHYLSKGEKDDAVAASVMLQGFLDAWHTSGITS